MPDVLASCAACPHTIWRTCAPSAPTLHDCFHRRADALFELTDALLAAESVTSLPHLSLQAAHRRGWGSLYDALAEGHLDVAALRTLLTRHVASEEQPVYAIDRSVWPRCDAEASPERGYYYHPSRHSAGQPIVAGWAYQWLAQLSFTRDSWTAPLDVQRVHPRQNANAVAVDQITELLGRLAPGGAPPLFVFDAGYDSVQLTQGLAPLPVAVLVRLRAGRCFYADPPPSVPSPQGRSPTHARREVRLRGSGDLAWTECRAPRRGQAVRHRACARLGGAASQASRPPGSRHS